MRLVAIDTEGNGRHREKDFETRINMEVDGGSISLGRNDPQGRKLRLEELQEAMDTAEEEYEHTGDTDSEDLREFNEDDGSFRPPTTDAGSSEDSSGDTGEETDDEGMKMIVGTQL